MYKQLLIDNIYSGQHIPHDCLLAKINHNLAKCYYGHCVRGKIMVIREEENYMFSFRYPNGNKIIGPSGDVPMLSENHFVVLPKIILPEELFIL